MKIGFIGWESWENPCAKNLLKAGHECTIYDIVEEAAREAVGAGAVKCESAAQAASGRELVITMLPNSPQVKQVVLGENGIADAMDEGCIFVDMSSIAPPGIKRNRRGPGRQKYRDAGCPCFRRGAKGCRRDAFHHGGRKERGL